MGVEIEYLGHSGFLLSGGGHTVCIDPFLEGNPLATRKPMQINCSAIAITHGHSDHIGDSVTIAQGCGATVYAAWEICNFFLEQGHEAVEPGNPGGKINTPFGWIAFTQAFHSSSFEGRYMGLPCGIVVNLGGVTVYHCGDTALFGDMKLLGEIYKPDIACIPVGDRFTMGPDLGKMAAEFIKPKVAIPIHYKTWPLLTSEISAFTPAGVEVKTMQPGETWRYG